MFFFRDAAGAELAVHASPPFMHAMISQSRTRRVAGQTQHVNRGTSSHTYVSESYRGCEVSMENLDVAIATCTTMLQIMS